MRHDKMSSSRCRAVAVTTSTAETKAPFIQENAPFLALLTVLIPVFNEVTTIKAVLQQLLQEPTQKEIIVIDDGSTDGTTELLRMWEAETNLKRRPPHIARVLTLYHPTNFGKGKAIRTGLAYATSEFLIVQDADLEVSPNEYPRLLDPLICGDADFVIGYRVQQAGSQKRYLHCLGIWILNTLVRVLYGIRVNDEACCFKVLRTTDLKQMDLECLRFDFCPEVVAKAAKLQMRFAQVSILYTPRNVAEGKKLGFRDGLEAISTLWKFRCWNQRR